LDALDVVGEFLGGFGCEADGESGGFDDVVVSTEFGVDVFFVEADDDFHGCSLSHFRSVSLSSVRSNSLILRFEPPRSFTVL